MVDGTLIEAATSLKSFRLKDKRPLDEPPDHPPGYAISQRIRTRVEEVFGWLKTVGGLRRTRYGGLARTQLAGYVVASADNLVRMARVLGQPVNAGRFSRSNQGPIGPAETDRALTTPRLFRSRRRTFFNHFASSPAAATQRY